MTGSPSFIHGHRFAGQHGFVEGAAAFRNGSVHRHLFAGTHAQDVAFPHLFERDILLLAVTDHPRLLRRQPHQLLNCSAGAFASAQLQHLAQQNQHNDHCGGFKIECHLAVCAERIRKNVGKERGNCAVEIGCARADGNQRKHVQVPRNDRLPAALEKRQAGPQHYRGGQYEFDPFGEAGGNQPADRITGKVASHGDDENRQRENKPNPEPSRHIAQFRIVFLLFASELLRLQRHAAFRAVARMILLNFGVHRTGIDGASRRSGLLFAGFPI